MSKRNGKLAIFAAGLIVGAFLVGSWLAGDSVATIIEAMSSHPSPASTASPETPPKDVIEVADQPAGDSVLVASVNVPNPGVWVAVREMNDGTLGNILGAKRARDPVTNISVPLLRPTLHNRTYAIVLYRDDGDGIFSYQTDSVYVDFATGDPIIAPFTAK